MSGARTGLVVMAYGTPSSADEVEAYYTDIRRGRPPTPEQLARLQARYEAIGGVSPLATRTRWQAEAIQDALDALAPGRFLVALGNKHSTPRIEDAVDRLAAEDAGALVGLVLAPHFSELSVGEYATRLAAQAKAAGLPSTMIESWHLLPALIEVLAERVDEVVRLSGAARTEVLFTAHSLPARILGTGDPYARQLEESAAAVAGAAGVSDWRTAWQSAGRTPEPWLGPDLRDVIRALPAEGVEAVVVCPIGFTSDHLEVLYDVDIEAKAVAAEVGLSLRRTPSLNDDERVCRGLAELVVEAAAS